MLRMAIIGGLAVALAACGQPQQADAPATPNAPQFRADADLSPLSLETLIASASDAGSRYKEIIDLPGPNGPVSAVFAHAPTSMIIALPAGSRELVVDYGLRDTAYTNGATSQGVCFAVSGGAAMNQLTELWRECLTPVEQPDHRGMHETSVALPEGTVFVGFATSANVANSTQFGHSYWANPRTH